MLYAHVLCDVTAVMTVLFARLDIPVVPCMYCKPSFSQFLGHFRIGFKFCVQYPAFFVQFAIPHGSLSGPRDGSQHLLRYFICRIIRSNDQVSHAMVKSLADVTI